MTHREYMGIAVPFVIATITTPLLGAVDTAVMGRLPDPAYIGGVAVGVVILNTMYWLLGFLRVSTTGFSSQAHGAGDIGLGMWALVRPLGIALCIGCAFILLQQPVLHAALLFLDPAPDARAHAEAYFTIVIWGAPCVLMNYVLLGWLMGQMRLRASLFLQVSTNAVNIVLSIWFVMGLSWGVEGVAASTLIAQGAGVGLGFYLVARYARFSWRSIVWRDFFDSEAMRKIVSVNRDLVIRTICLLAVTNMFVAKGGSFGKEILAGNAVLLQIQYLMAYFFDGLANASSVVAGRASGAEDRVLLRRAVSLSAQWCLFGTLLVSCAYLATYDMVFRLFTSIPEVLAFGSEFGLWMVVFPVCGSVGLVFYGLFSGATLTAPIRNSMLFSLAAYSLAQYGLTPVLGNHGLILAFLVFSLSRSLFLLPYLPRLLRSV
ncbi:MATE family efflux transporter [Desulfovibrio psychrotolerans]|uniref:MATE family efflux transporter n=1 Tax=Desulfovibrio psychrotolerans TaxID=415242 RepID=A0A7J0BS54_9BACT|nr:MATE family efflux transporter [Desulfovibrio psychrotolerans]GFM36012.1 MATE family efflux transporter [Desulfovibrio psychrotolerans]